MTAGFRSFGKRLVPGALTDPEVFSYAISVTVWGRWFVVAVTVSLLAYRPATWYPQDVEYLLLPVATAAVNGIVHHRLLTKGTVSWRWMSFLSVSDVSLITYGIVVGGGFSSLVFVFYYPALAVFAVVFSSFGLTLACTTIVAVIYTVVCLVVGPDLTMGLSHDKALVARLAVMYTLAPCIGFITRFERFRWRGSVARERQLRQERIEISQTIHDTTAQTAYLISLGIHKARKLAGESDDELAATLDATLTLTKSAMWEMRGPIDAGHIVEGRELGRVLWSHCATFKRIAGVPAELSLSGLEPPMSTDTRNRLFSVAHNALTNAFLHARPTRVDVRLSFDAEWVILSVSDDGVGLPDDYAQRGRGFIGMKADAEHVDGKLIVESLRGCNGTTVTCVVPYSTHSGGC